MARSLAEFTYCTSTALLLRTQSLPPISSIAYCLISIPNILPSALPFTQQPDKAVLGDHLSAALDNLMIRHKLKITLMGFTVAFIMQMNTF